MTSLFLSCIILFLITYFSIKKFITLAPKLSLVDIPNSRSSHKKITPRGAGMVFGFIFILGILVFDFENFSEIKYTLLAIFLIYLCGVLDDKFDISPKQKLVFIIVSSAIVYFNGYQITNAGTFFNVSVNLGYLALPFTIFAIVAFTNAVNLSDGLDGLAGSISVIILTAIFVIGYIYHDNTLMVWSAILISVILAFLVLNWHPAKVFMGDSGSLLLGFVIAILSIKSLNYVNPVSVLFLAAVPILDTLVVFRRRIQRGMSPFTADKNHIHHILNNIKQDKAFTVKMLLSIQLVFSCMFLQLHHQDDALNLVIFFLLFSIFFNLFDPRARRRAKTARLRKKYERIKQENKALKEKKVAKEEVIEELKEEIKKEIKKDYEI
ncbi:MAG: undecaprenyl/decaprenyl-phosphate alpha-N-acetylglucosaminyl 1-phosphate transferase [Erysipelotrichia bacterium]|nr:undecaprenyl/decaprenyl-phosphate alpha-N-acetylglucosaminyl 1-phosphate transferase [Erysipelotrichia bacterium]